jgi:hypothetical protein
LKFFLPVISPLFFVETLADLEKKVRVGVTPEEVVGGISAKTPTMSGFPNIHHFNLIVSELMELKLK